MTDSNEAVFSAAAARRGKLGLALSGGGFRAALFHIGVLAQMAEQDLLRHVGVISTVSGGSIIGAFYYLKVRQLLESRREDKIAPSAESYRLLVRELESEFVVAVQRNLRLVTFADGRQNARMLGEKYTSTMRLSDLFNEHFFSPLTGSAGILLKDLAIAPAFESSVVDAAGADAPPIFCVPELVVNATALNTGHLFQFTSEFVGESEVSSVVGGTQTMPYLQRLSYRDSTLAPVQRARLDSISIGDAVAASCCVPGLLEPFNLEGLYRDQTGGEVIARLVDGGVFDNQGLVSLYESACTHFICSDASDLLKWQAQPEERIHTVAMRANDIMMDRIRGELMDELSARGADNSVVFSLGDRASSGIFKDDAELIAALSGIRTDLDAFADIEASTLMYYGFQLSADKLGNSPLDMAPGWGFSAIQSLAEDVKGRERLLRFLQVGSHQFLKVFYLGRPLPYAIIVVPLVIPAAMFALLIYFLPPIPVSAWAVLAGLAVVGIAFSQNARITERLDQIPAFARFRKRLAVAMKPLGITVILGIIGAGVSWVNLKIFNRLFLKYGRLD